MGSIRGISNSVGKILFGLLLDKSERKIKIYLIIANSIINAVAVIASAFLSSFASQMINAAIFGFSFGGYIVSSVVILKILYDDITEMLALWFMIMGVSAIVGPTFVGEMFDHYGSYTVGLVATGGSSLLGAILIPLAYHCSDVQRRLTH